MIRNAYECADAILAEYAEYLNSRREDDAFTWTPQAIKEEMTNARITDLDEEGYSLATEVWFEFDQMPIALHGYFGRVDQKDWNKGLKLKYVMFSADFGDWELINKEEK